MSMRLQGRPKRASRGPQRAPERQKSGPGRSPDRPEGANLDPLGTIWGANGRILGEKELRFGLKIEKYRKTGIGENR